MDVHLLPGISLCIYRDKSIDSSVYIIIYKYYEVQSMVTDLIRGQHNFGAVCDSEHKCF